MDDGERAREESVAREREDESVKEKVSVGFLKQGIQSRFPQTTAVVSTYPAVLETTAVVSPYNTNLKII